MRRSFNVIAASAALAFASVAATPAAAWVPSQIVTFGDSFIDSGNIQAAVGPAFTNPDLGYWYGRFSDGPNWVDLLSVANLGSYSQASLLGGTNYAFGGARAAQDDIVGPGQAIPGLATQLGMFALQGGGVDPNALYVINFGNNDVNAIQSGDTEGLTVLEYQQAFVGNIVNAVATLSFFGAQHILVAGVPNPTEIEGLQLQALLNAGLDTVEPLPSNLYRFDYFAFFLALQADPTQFGLPADIDLDTPCLLGETPSRDIDCTGYLSFDGIHVTSAVQRAISIEVANQIGINAVPEPATWAMLITGFGLVGLAARRRRPGTLARQQA
jgi:phospholipase/lecithinase/hemolysin